MKIINECPTLLAGIITAEKISQEPNAELTDKLTQLVNTRKNQDFPNPELKKAVRDMLKAGGFKPTGRNKPASEYLAQAAREDRFPFVGTLVDINNYFSLFSGVPMSILDKDVTGEDITLRYGKEGEKYIFNKSGQEIELKGLISICDASEPFGNPIKDSMKAKIGEHSKNIITVIYAPKAYFDFAMVEELCRKTAAWLLDYAKAQSTAITVV